MIRHDGFPGNLAKAHERREHVRAKLAEEETFKAKDDLVG